MTRRNAYSARNAHSAEVRAALARIKRPAPPVRCPVCKYHDSSLCAERASGHVWPVRS